MAMAISVPLYTVDDLEKLPKDGKRDAYFALGVRQVWLVDWRDESVEVCTAKGKCRVVRDQIRWRISLTDVVVDLPQVFAGCAAESSHESES
jgi:Uma2 family endonuclease